MENYIKQYFKNVSKNFLELQNQSKSIESAIEIIYKSLKKDNKIIFCGNGGSASDSQHLAAELMGRYKLDRDPLPAISLSVDTSALTAIGNDYGYEYTFSRQLKGLGNSGDVLVAISTSGESENVVKAAEVAKEMNIYTIAFTGENISSLSEIVDLSIYASSQETNHIQEMHIAIGQLICGAIEDKFFKRN
tara:strand:- start:5 stop:577 length:573 start_codon:yes stop_codon:yes gene_type:complete